MAQGAVATAQGLGAALSATLAGVIIVASGYSAAFLVLAAIAGAGFALYLLFMPETAGYTPPGTQTGAGVREPALREGGTQTSGAPAAIPAE